MIKTKKKSKKEESVGNEITETACANPSYVAPVLIDKLTMTFPNEDMNKLVEKINEIIEKQNGTI